MEKTPSYPPKRARQVRVSDKIKHAVQLIARNGLTQADAAKAAGLSRQGLNEALRRPEVAELLRSARAALEGDISQLRQVGRLAAIEKAMELMRTSKDEKIQLRAAEFLAGESKGGPAVAVNVDLRQEPATGYRYRRPEGYLTPSPPPPPLLSPDDFEVVD
ncbi:MAG: hypothetical protein JNK34_01395 [Tabrizicola sp.]|nr:hypothetical protein [Tabrizicola sp.]